MKGPKRHKIICAKCGAEQSTYSTNREHCHACRPKCREQHTFPVLKKFKEKVETE
jgi:ribosomal protein L40E